MPPTAWMISNRQPYGEEIDHPDSLLLAGPQLLGRFTTTPLAKKGGKVSGGSAADAAAAAGCCNITRLGPGACVETAEAAGRIKRHLEVVLDRRLQMLVADFTRDDRDRLWFLQVRGLFLLVLPFAVGGRVARLGTSCCSVLLEEVCRWVVHTNGGGGQLPHCVERRVCVLAGETLSS